MGRSRYPLRLHPSLMEEARKAAESEGVALNQLFSVAVAEQLAAMRTVTRFQERIRRAGRPKTLHILDLTGIGNLRWRATEFKFARSKYIPHPHQIVRQMGKALGKRPNRSEGQLPNLASSRNGWKELEDAELVGLFLGGKKPSK